MYCSLPTLDFFDKSGSLSPLDWWKEKSGLLPNLALLAKKYLCIPATSAPVERVFSRAGLTISKKRNALNCDVASDLIFLNSNWEVLRFDDIYCQPIQVKRVEEANIVDITDELEDDYEMLDDIENIF